MVEIISRSAPVEIDAENDAKEEHLPLFQAKEILHGRWQVGKFIGRGIKFVLYYIKTFQFYIRAPWAFWSDIARVNSTMLLWVKAFLVKYCPRAIPSLILLRKILPRAISIHVLQRKLGHAHIVTKLFTVKIQSSQ